MSIVNCINNVSLLRIKIAQTALFLKKFLSKQKVLFTKKTAKRIFCVMLSSYYDKISGLSFFTFVPNETHNTQDNYC